jgi:MYXO-CTERM domain-containing protein
MPLPSPDAEVGLQELFDFTEGAGVLDSKADAGTQPATFKPLCDFSAQLLLHETGNRTAFVGWYNSPIADVAPSTVCDEQTDLSSDGGPCTENDIFVLIRGDVADPPFGKSSDPLHHPGAIFTGGDIADNKYYAGGEIGFVLMSSQGHFSETRLNPPCSGTTCTDGDRWIPSIIYQSKKTPRGYYMCSEDQDVGPTEWGGNDGDFNDYVFLFTGLVCSGSGEACDTGQPGVCAAGLTDCADALGESECRPARAPSDEACNGLDDDCDGDTDEGDLCPEHELCVKARCVPRCGTGELRCDNDHQCVSGACVEKSCVDVSCAPGMVCMGGRCTGACDDVVCPIGQSCHDGVCVDPCAGIDCGDGFVCEGGACRVECSCAGCSAGGECDTESGHCVGDGCAGKTCDAGLHCAAGECVDDCADVHCPGGAACERGACLPPPNGRDEPGAGGASGLDPGISFGATGATGATGTGATGATGSGHDGSPTAGTAAGNADNQDDGKPGVEPKSGCSCRAAGGESSPIGWRIAVLGLLLALRRRRSAS